MLVVPENNFHPLNRSRSIGRELQALSRQREVKISSPFSEDLGAANTWWQLEDILLDKAKAHPVVCVEESDFPLPTMLITNSVMDSVHEAINEHRKANPPRRISKCIRLDRLDQHMVGAMKNVRTAYNSKLPAYVLLENVCFFGRGRFFV